MSALYLLLGLEKSADTAAIARAYRRLALQYHPDRNPDGADKFKELTKAYEVLGDAEKRALYDATGVVPGDDSAAEAQSDEVRMKNRSAELEHEIKAFYETYRGSPEEAADLAEAYKATKGNMEDILFEHALYENEKGEVGRMHAILSQLIADGALTATKRWAATSTARRLKQYSKELAEERDEAKEELHKIRGGGGADVGGLQLMLAQRNKAQASAWEAMTEGLAAKFGGKKKSGGAGKKKKSQ
jgi:DnaJ family protein C protein 9